MRWEAQRQLLWLGNDHFNAVLDAMADILVPLLIGRSWGAIWQGPALTALLYTAKAFQLRYGHLARARGRIAANPSLYRRQRSALICLERLMRLWVACYAAVRVDYYRGLAASIPSSPGTGYPAAPSTTLLQALADLLHGTGLVMALWHSQLIPVPLTLEVPLLASITHLSVRWRVPALLRALDNSAGAVVVVGVERWLAWACRASCTTVVALHQGAQGVCEPGGPEPRTQLAVALILWLTLLVPLYVR